jgi:hypothetical protein
MGMNLVSAAWKVCTEIVTKHLNIITETLLTGDQREFPEDRSCADDRKERERERKFIHRLS